MTPDEKRDDLAARCGDTGPVLFQDDGPLGPRWWTATRAYGLDLSDGELVSIPRNPPGSGAS